MALQTAISSADCEPWDQQSLPSGPPPRISQTVYISRQIAAAFDILPTMTAKDLRRILRSHGCIETRQRGSHVRVECGACVTTVPMHAGEDLGPGLLRQIERDLEPCLGKGWLKKQ